MLCSFIAFVLFGVLFLVLIVAYSLVYNKETHLACHPSVLVLAYHYTTVDWPFNVSSWYHQLRPGLPQSWIERAISLSKKFPMGSIFTYQKYTYRILASTLSLSHKNLIRICVGFLVFFPWLWGVIVVCSSFFNFVILLFPVHIVIFPLVFMYLPLFLTLD